MKTFKTLMITMLALLCSITATAQDFEVDGIYYGIFSSEDNHVYVTYNGASWTTYKDRYVGDIVIPDTVVYNGDTYKVTAIGNHAFCKCDQLINITIGNNVTVINQGAFYECTSLKSAIISNSVKKIEGSAFGYCTSLEYISIGNGITSFGNRIFYDCNALKAVNIGDLSAWCNIDFMNKDDNPLFYAGKLYVNGVLLTELIIPDSVTFLGKSTFVNCSSICKVVIPSSVTTISYYAFSGCTGIKEVEFYGKTFSNAFAGISSIENVILGNNVVNIASGAFSGCSGLKSLKIPGSVKKIGNNAFDGCSKLTNLTFEAGADTLFMGYESTYHKPLFNECKIDTVFLDRNIKPSDNSYLPFVENKTLKFLKIGENATYIHDGMFRGCASIVDFEMGKNVFYIGSSAFYGCVGIKDVEINCSGSARGTIGNGAFSGCSNLEKVFIENAVIETGAFYNCKKLSELVLSDKVTSIGSSAFCGCTSLTKLRIPDTVKAIEEGAFRECSNLKEISFGKRVNYIGDYAFEGCSNIETIYALPDRAINCSAPDYTFDDNVYKYATLYVKEASLDSYETTQPWSRFYIEAMSDFTLTYYVDGEIYEECKYGYDEDILPLVMPEKEGYTFSGWTGLPEKMPSHDVAVTGSYDINSYKLTYEIDGEVYYTTIVEYGDTIPEVDLPVKEGHTFNGWSEMPETMPANDIVIKGSFSVNSYMIFFMVDDTVYSMATIKYGEAIELPSPPAKDGYTFSYWEGLPDKMPAGNVVVYAVFEENTAIDNVIPDVEQAVYYDLSGRKVENPTSGIYIVNGKKVLIK